MPPLALTHAAHAGATVANWLLLDACDPVIDPTAPILIVDPDGAGAPEEPAGAADGPLPPDVPDFVLLLLHADTASAAPMHTATTFRTLPRADCFIVRCSLELWALTAVAHWCRVARLRYLEGCTSRGSHYGRIIEL